MTRGISIRNWSINEVNGKVTYTHGKWFTIPLHTRRSIMRRKILRFVKGII